MENPGKELKLDTLHFQVVPDSFSRSLFSTMSCVGSNRARWGSPAEPPRFFRAVQRAHNQLVIESVPSDEPFDLVVRDGKTGFIFFNIEGNQ